MVTSKRSKDQSNTRDAILQAARQVIIAHGVEAMTLEAVAREAEVSKGGLLYHFPNKEALIEGMVRQVVDQRTQALHQAFEQDDTPAQAGRWTRAYVRDSETVDEQEFSLCLSLLAAISFNPDLLALAQERTQEWQHRLETDGLSPARATLIRLAIDGLHFAHVFGLAPPEEPLRTQVIEALLELARPDKVS